MAEFVSTSDWAFYDGWMMVAIKRLRYFALVDGVGLDCFSDNKVKLIELNDDDAVDTVTELTTNDMCTEPAISSKRACREALGITTRALVAPMRLQYSPRHRVFAVLGKTPGPCVIKATRDKKEVQRLRVTVAKEIRVPVAFHSVRHQPPGSGLVAHSKVSEMFARNALSLANDIMAQAGTRFYVHQYKNADVPVALPREISVHEYKEGAGPPPTTKAILAKRNKTVRINVYLVGEVANAQDSGAVTLDKKDVFVDHRGGPLGLRRALAHEMGHILGIGDRSGGGTKIRNDKGFVTRVEPESNLMAEKEYDGKGLVEAQVNVVRAKASEYASLGHWP